MTRCRPPRRRSPAEWGARAVLALGAGLIGYGAVTQTLASAISTGAAEHAHRLAPGNGRIAALLSEKWAGAEASAEDRVSADQLARLALRQDPTAVAAVATLGIDAQIRGETTSARRLFAYAEKLSRRDLRTEIWAIEDAVGRGNVVEALKHYDVALRTSKSAPDLLFPILASAITDPAIRSALVATLSGKPLWGPVFVDYVAGNAADPRAVSSLFSDMHRVGLPVGTPARTRLIGALIVGDLFDDAWSYYASVRPGADRRRSRDARFTADLDDPSPFDWGLINDASISASIQRDDKGGIFDFAAPASVGGPVLRQMQMLPSGDYRLQGHSAGIEQPDASRPYWTMSCRDGRELGRVDMPNSTVAGGSFAGQFTVPADCPVQYLSLIARSSDLVSGASGQIDWVQVGPAGRSSS